jgi:hypothetical protein
MIPVKLPKEVLSLFPMWEYCCPCCGTYVESNISFCPNCKTRFDEKKWRVPPRFLKSHDALSEYAHRVLAPKLTPEQRELLFQYFTEFFSDGFESGNYNAWNGATGGATKTVTGDAAHCGDYGFRISSLDTSGEWGQLYKTFGSSYSTLYIRNYIRFVGSLFNIGPRVAGVGAKGTNWIAFTIVDVPNNKWGIYDYTAGTSRLESGTSTISADTWYCQELRITIHSTEGILQLWIDGELKVDATGLDTSGYGDLDEVDIIDYLYPASGNESSPRTIDHDCFIAADTYIGPEGGVTYTKTWQTDVLFEKLGITKSLGVDAAFQKQDTPKTFGLYATFQKSIVTQKQIDVLFKRFGILKSFAVDARFGALMTQTIMRQIDVLLKRLDATKTFGLDVYFGPVEAETYAKSFGLSIIFAYKVRLPELWLDENGKLVLNISKPYMWVGT